MPERQRQHPRAAKCKTQDSPAGPVPGRCLQLTHASERGILPSWHCWHSSFVIVPVDAARPRTYHRTHCPGEAQIQSAGRCFVGRVRLDLLRERDRRPTPVQDSAGATRRVAPANHFSLHRHGPRRRGDGTIMGFLDKLIAILRGGPSERARREDTRPAASKGSRRGKKRGRSYADKYDTMELSRRLGMPATDIQLVEVAYNEFTIPKRRGGLRRILAPAPPLKALRAEDPPPRARQASRTRGRDGLRARPIHRHPRPPARRPGRAGADGHSGLLPEHHGRPRAGILPRSAGTRTRPSC